MIIMVRLKWCYDFPWLPILEMSLMSLLKVPRQPSNLFSPTLGNLKLRSLDSLKNCSSDIMLHHNPGSKSLIEKNDGQEDMKTL
jgi:hypothetical protein